MPKKLERLVRKLQREGKSEKSAWAIGTSSLQKAGVLKGTRQFTKGKKKRKK